MKRQWKKIFSLLLGLYSAVHLSACDFDEEKKFSKGLSSSGGSGGGSGTSSDSRPIVTVSSGQAIEGNPITFTASLSKASSETITVGYATIDGTAIGGSDYAAAASTITFNPGDLTKTFTIATTADFTAELTETFTVAISGGTNYNETASTKLVLGTIITDDVNVSVNDVSATEGSTLTFTVSLSSISTNTVTVDYATANGTATLADSDYTNTSGTLTFAPGETTKTFTVNTTTDVVNEADETFTVNLSGGSNYVVATSDLSGTGTITNDDPLPTLSIANDSQSEGVALSHTVTLSAVSGQTVTVNYATSNGTATLADSDYTNTSGTLTFNPGQTVKTFTVNTTSDTKYEANETVNLTLSGGANYNSVGSTLTAVGTITNDEAVPSVSIAAASGTEAGNVVFTVTQSGTSAFANTFDYTSSSGTATSGTDFTATAGTGTIAAGATTTTITVPATEDSIEESDETFTMTLSNPSANVTINTAAATGTIVDTILFYNFLSAALPAGTTFTRASTGTYTDSSGNISSAALNTPRFDYDPTSCAGTCAIRGLLMEPASTNLLLRSAELNNAAWTPSGLQAIAADSADAATPDGVNTSGELLQENAANSTHVISQTVNITAGALLHFTIYAKNSTVSARNYFRINIRNGTDNIRAHFDLTGANSPVTTFAGTGGGQISASMVDVGNGWKKIRLSGVATSGTTVIVNINLQNSFQSSTTYVGNNASGINFWGAQLEQSISMATSYIPTAGATASRSADMLSVDSFTGFAGNFGNGTNFTMITDFSRPQFESTATSASPRAAEFCISATCSNNRITTHFSSSAQTWGAESIIAGASQGNSLTGAIAGSDNTTYQLGVVNTAGSIRTYLNGTAYGASAALSYPAVDTLYIGGSSYAGSELLGHLKKFTYRARSVPNANMLTLTSD